MCVFFQARLTMAELSECRYSFSSGSKSQTVLPRSTLPAEGIAPALASSASASVVLPAPVWPTSATVRMASVEYLGMRKTPPLRRARAATGSGVTGKAGQLWPYSTLAGAAASKPPPETEHAYRDARQSIGDPDRDPA